MSSGLFAVCVLLVLCPLQNGRKFHSLIIIGTFLSFSASHRDPDAIKTDAPPEFIWDIMRCWVKMHPIKVG